MLQPGTRLGWRSNKWSQMQVTEQPGTILQTAADTVTKLFLLDLRIPLASVLLTGLTDIRGFYTLFWLLLAHQIFKTMTFKSSYGTRKVFFIIYQFV